MVSTLKIVASLDQLSIEARQKVIEGFVILERRIHGVLSAEEKAVVDTAKELLAQADVSVNQSS